MSQSASETLQDTPPLGQGLESGPVQNVGRAAQRCPAWKQTPQHVPVCQPRWLRSTEQQASPAALTAWLLIADKKTKQDGL